MASVVVVVSGGCGGTVGRPMNVCVTVSAARGVTCCTLLCVIVFHISAALCKHE